MSSSANGQPNPAAFNANGQSDRRVINPPTGNQIVTIGGQQQQVSPCLACVTVGLTPALIGQFVAVSPSSTAGVVPFARIGPDFPDPYGSRHREHGIDGVRREIHAHPPAGQFDGLRDGPCPARHRHAYFG